MQLSKILESIDFCGTGCVNESAEITRMSQTYPVGMWSRPVPFLFLVVFYSFFDLWQCNRVFIVCVFYVCRLCWLYKAMFIPVLLYGSETYMWQQRLKVIQSSELKLLRRVKWCASADINGNQDIWDGLKYIALVTK